MNRAQRRKDKKNSKGMVLNFPKKKMYVPKKQPAPEQPDFSQVPLATMCQSIQLLVNELYERGYPLYDYDQKERSLQQIQIIQGKVYFLAAKEAQNEHK